MYKVQEKNMFVIKGHIINNILKLKARLGVNNITILKTWTK